MEQILETKILIFCGKALDFKSEKDPNLSLTYKTLWQGIACSVFSNVGLIRQVLV